MGDKTFRDEILKYSEEETQDVPTAATQGNTSQESGGEPVVNENELRLGPPGPPFGIVINGASLVSKPLISLCTCLCCSAYTLLYLHTTCVHIYLV